MIIRRVDSSHEPDLHATSSVQAVTSSRHPNGFYISNTRPRLVLRPLLMNKESLDKSITALDYSLFSCYCALREGEPY